MHVQALPVEAFDEGIVRGSSWSRELDADFMMIRPEIDHVTGKFAAVVGKQPVRSIASPDQPIENINDMLSTQSLAALDSQCFTRIDIDNIMPGLLLVRQLVVDEVECPGLIGAWLAEPCPPGGLPSCDGVAVSFSEQGLPRDRADRRGCGRQTSPHASA